MINFFISGLPVPQPRQRVGMLNGHARTFTPKTLKRKDGSRKVNPIFTWKDAIALAAKPHVPAKPLEGPLDVSIRFYLPRPEAHYRSNGQLKDTAPYYHIGARDRDNLDKAVLDILTNLKFWGDDGQVCDGRLTKFYANDGKTGADVTISLCDPTGRTRAVPIFELEKAPWE